VRRLADLPTWSRIAIVCLIPLLAFTGFAGKDMLEKRAQSQSADSAAALIEVAPLISSLVHELQKERGSSVGFVSSKGQALAETMRPCRTKSRRLRARSKVRWWTRLPACVRSERRRRLMPRLCKR
jgi:Nitrate and nitrite sensing